MVLFNYATRELTAKVVYYGPGLGGKTTNLEQIHKSLPEKTRGKMLSLATQTDRTLFFDFLPMDLGTVKGMKTRVQLYTVPGQVFYDATRKLVLKGADAVVFVADSQNEMLESNLESWENLKQNLMENNLDINTIPVVIQYNKRDLPNVMPVKDLNQKINVIKAPYFEAIAIRGIGVPETLKGIAKVVLRSLQRRYAREEVMEGQVEIRADEMADIEAMQEADAKSEATAPSGVVLPTDVTLDFAALEEIRELPDADELEIGGEDASMTLEPLPEAPEELHAIEELEEIVEVSSSMPVAAPAVEPKAEEAKPVAEIAAASPKSAKRPAVSYSEELEKLRSTSVHPRRKLPDLSRDSLPQKEPETAVAGARSASTLSQTINVPVEVSVEQEGKEVKLQIAIQLKIHILPRE